MRPLLWASSAAAVFACSCGSGLSQTPSWDRLQSDYAYSKSAPKVTETVKDTADGTVETHISFPSPDGSTVTGVFVRPKKDGVYPVVLLLHGLGDSKDHIVQFRPGGELGVALLALDVPYHGERRTKETDHLMGQMFMSSFSAKSKGDLMTQVNEVDKDHKFSKLFAHMVHEGVMDYRLALDYLESRKDVDKAHIGLMGVSLGSIMGSILSGVDHRVRFEVLGIGGDPALPFAESEPTDFREEFYDACSSLFIGHATAPVLMLNGTKDQVINKAATDRLFAAAIDPKSIKWFEAGHAMTPEAVKEASSWALGQLKGKP